MTCIVESAYGIEGYLGLLDAELAALDTLIDSKGIGRGGERHTLEGPLPAPAVRRLASAEPEMQDDRRPCWQNRVLLPRKAGLIDWLKGHARYRLRRLWALPTPKRIAALLESASRRLWFSTRRSDLLPLILSKKQAPVWERIGLAPLPESVLDDTVRVPLARWHPRQLPLWERLEGIPLPPDVIIGTEAHLVAKTMSALAGRLRPDTKLIVSGRPTEADHSFWQTCHPLGFGLWLCTGLHLSSTPVPAMVKGRAGGVGPRISVVTISYNQAPFLEATLRSVLEQDYPNFEYIVIDGGSTDGSRDILERYRSRITTLIIEPDKGQSDALCKGFALATGDVLTWLCSDDLLEPGALRHVADAFARYDVDIIAGGCRVIDAAGNHKLLHHNGLPFETPVPLSFGDLAGFLGVWQKTMYFFQPELFFSRRLWEASGGFIKHHLHYAMDYDLFLRFAMAAPRLVHISQTLAASRMHDTQKTQHQNQEYLPTIRLILREYRALVAALAEQTIVEDFQNMS